MQRITLFSGMILLLGLFLTSCIKDQEVIVSQSYTDAELQVLNQYLKLPAERDQYAVKLPEHMTRFGGSAPIINDAKATLGRVLFYDTKLSATGETSCESCHKQSLAFSDDKALSEGINGQLTKRNSLPLASVANFSSSYGGGPSFVGGFGGVGFFWDERAATISEQSELTIQDDIEMGKDLHELSTELGSLPHYKILFKKAYNSEVVTSERVLDAIQEFVNSFVSVNSRFDEGMDRVNHVDDDFPNFTAEENLGKRIYVQNCGSCHSSDMSSPTFASLSNNGLDVVYEDNGLGDLTYETSHNGLFKVPFLRNIALTGPYMHDGRFETLEEVVEHYSTGIQDHPNLSANLKNNMTNEPMRFNFTDEEKAALIAFLNTVTDHSFVEQTRFSDPF